MFSYCSVQLLFITAKKPSDLSLVVLSFKSNHHLQLLKLDIFLLETLLFYKLVKLDQIEAASTGTSSSINLRPSLATSRPFPQNRTYRMFFIMYHS